MVPVIIAIVVQIRRRREKLVTDCRRSQLNRRTKRQKNVKTEKNGVRRLLQTTAARLLDKQIMELLEGGAHAEGVYM